MFIQKANVNDAQEILLLQKIAFLSEAEIYNNYNLTPLVQTLDELIKEFEEKTFYKAILDDKIVGSVRVFIDNNETCHIRNFVVLPEYQNKGIGSQIIRAIEIDFKNCCKRFEIFTGYKSERNIYLYKKLGYVLYKTTNELVYLEKTSDTIFE